MNAAEFEKVREAEWQGKSGMIKAGKELKRKLMSQGKYADAHMVMVSPYYSAIKRGGIFAAWYFYQAITHARAVVKYSSHTNPQHPPLMTRSPAELNVLASALSLAPKFCKGTLRSAYECARIGVTLEQFPKSASKLLSHDLALNWLILGKIEMKMKMGQSKVWMCYQYAETIANNIFNKMDQFSMNERKMAKRQLSRIYSTLGFFFWEHGLREERDHGYTLLYRALTLTRDAEAKSLDQEKKILRMIQKMERRIR